MVGDEVALGDPRGDRDGLLLPIILSEWHDVANSSFTRRKVSNGKPRESGVKSESYQGLISLNLLLANQ